VGNNKLKKELAILVITILGVVGVMLFVVPAQDVDKRQRANEASTVAQLRRLTSIEKGYSQQHAREG
jgi:hypothetical protein